jgi:SAM-dependent methyltransferase
LKLFLKNPASAGFAIKGRFYNAITRLLPGKKVKCNICNWEGRRFFAIAGASYIRYNAICPACGSAERNRALIKYMNKRGSLDRSGLKCLEIGPFRGSRAYFEARSCDYISIDNDSEFATRKMDVTRLEFPENSLDLIICSHVLEHVVDDIQAMREIYRALRNEGTCNIMVPFNRSKTATIEYEKPNPQDPLHVRHYGMDIVERMKSTGFNVMMLDLVAEASEPDVRRYGLGDEEICFICTKLQPNSAG